MHASQGWRGPSASGDPKRSTNCIFANGFFRPQFILQINLSSFQQEWLDCRAWGVGSGQISPSKPSRVCPTSCQLDLLLAERERE
jgi:hypothetical protein